MAITEQNLREVLDRLFAVERALPAKPEKALLELGKTQDYVRDLRYILTGEMENPDGEPPF